ncbi:hypothetical protein KBB96_01460 [Luteolibacter ambystomatis]|uniref:Uncharacterized protein n=1 Tax=Luteolibacter ambystomatis TaxID=2824561 RepID=A0A975J052_9BACT|nr:hypothetical protein [Luteolibacter ambystomatis]QUE51573.1 hypothetical protein KBB96_01460 [Luteolibacter ambystomatis]
MKMPRMFPLALTAMTLIPMAADAVTAPQGTVLMGFRVTGGTGVGSSYVVDIGLAESYRDATGPITITNLAADLEIRFGFDWQTRTDLFYGVGACPDSNAAFHGDAEDTLYLSRPQTAENVPGTSPSINTSSGRATIAANLTDVLGVAGVSGFRYSAVSPGNSHASRQPDTDPNSWRQYMGPGGVAGKAGNTGNFDFSWSQTGGGEIEGTPDKTLSLFRISGGTAATYLGYFKIQGNGDVVYTPAPSSVNYTTWAATNAGGQSYDQDFDGDGISNGVEFFTGTPGNASTSHIGVTNGHVIWPRATGRTVTTVFVQTSTNLQTWTDVGSNLAGGTGSIDFTLPTGQSKIFARLRVVP